VYKQQDTVQAQCRHQGPNQLYVSDNLTLLAIQIWL